MLQRVAQRKIVLPALFFLFLALVGAYVVGELAGTHVDLPEMVVRKASLGTLEGGYYPLLLETNRGKVEGHYYPALNAQRGAIFIPGADNGWEEAANGLYPRLCKELPGEGIACLIMHYRNVDDPMECILDVVAGIRYLESQDVSSVALMGHSRGGMIVIYTAVAMPAVRTVVTLATEGVESELVKRLGPRCSILLIHGMSDRIISYQTSEKLYQAAHEPKRLIIYKANDHLLDRAADEVHQEVHSWIVQQLEGNAR
jgi:hypothetical protein